jgi:hypothetical protein
MISRMLGTTAGANIQDYLAGCVLQFKATEMAGTSVADSMGSRVGTLTAGSQWTTGFNNTGAFVTDRTHMLTTPVTGINTTSTFTWIIIAKPTSFYTGLAGTLLLTTAGYQYIAINPTSGWLFSSYYMNSTTFSTVSSNIKTLNNWYFIAAQRTLSPAVLTIYVKNLTTNSALSKFSTGTGAYSAYWGGPTTFEVGRTASNYSFQGEVDLVQIFPDIALSENVIAQICKFHTGL